MTRIMDNQLVTLNVTYFTDPLCCWSWGMQPHLDALQAQFKDRMTIKYVMGGMLPSWKSFADNTHAISRPAQMGPVWMHAAQLTHRPINYSLWMKDPPVSSYPACIAVKCAALQSTEAGIHLFKKLQETAMLDSGNIAHTATIRAVVDRLSQEFPQFDRQQYSEDWRMDRGMASFKEDLESTSKYGITRFPSLMIEAAGKQGIRMHGFRTVEILRHAIGEAFPDVETAPMSKKYFLK